MNEKLRKIAAMAAALTVSLGILSSCSGINGGGNNSDGGNVFRTYCVEAGYGSEWLKSLLDLFKEQDWVKEKYPDLEIAYPTVNDVRSYAGSMINAGSKTNNFDLLFAIGANSYGVTGGELLNLYDGVYNTEVPGENVLYKDKVATSLLESHRYYNLNDPESDEYYFTSWIGGMSSFVYNATVLESFDIKVPNTTDEFVAACAAIKANEGAENGKYDKGSSIIISFTDADYWQYVFPIWWAQYDGIEEYNNFYNGIYNGRYSVDIFKREGRLESLKVIKQLLDYDKGYLDKNSFTYQFMQAQTAYLQGNDVFFFTGDWFTNEMKATYNQLEERGKLGGSFGMMRCPVVSALGVKLGITDAELSAVVDYVDGATATKPTVNSSKGYTQDEIIARVEEARTVNYSLASDHVAFVPKYADNKDVAQDFLRFMATDAANVKYTEITGSPLYFDYSMKDSAPEVYNVLPKTAKDSVDFFQNSGLEVYTLRYADSFPLVMYGGLSPLATTHYVETLAGRNGESPQQLFDNTITLWTSEKFNRTLAAAGLV